jgi:diguanylate cyclase (GGDEF)-like protein
MADRTGSEQPPTRFAWLLNAVPNNERTLRMEGLIARVRVVIMLLNTVALAFLLDTSGMNERWAWALIAASWVYAVPIAVLQPYRRWKLFRGSFVTAAIDFIAIAAFVGLTGGGESPFFVLYYLAIVSVAMRFELRQALVSCLFAILTYALVYFATWEASVASFGVLFVRCGYMFLIAVGTGHLAREERTRAQQVQVIEKLNAENAKLMSRNERAARIDRVTGLLNRAHLEKLALRELRKARSSDGYVSILFCDMDRLKRINDELGHDAGDRILRDVAKAMKQCLRGSEVIGRYGGDEFVAVLPNLARETAFERGEQLIQAVLTVNRRLTEDLHIGLSVGVATCPFDATEFGMLVKLADQAMYLAKREGGSRVRTGNDLRVFWEEIPRAS